MKPELLECNCIDKRDSDKDFEFCMRATLFEILKTVVQCRTQNKSHKIGTQFRIIISQVSQSGNCLDYLGNLDKLHKLRRQNKTAKYTTNHSKNFYSKIYLAFLTSDVALIFRDKNLTQHKLNFGQ